MDNFTQRLKMIAAIGDTQKSSVDRLFLKTSCLSKALNITINYFVILFQKVSCFQKGRIIALFYSVVLFALNFVRIFDNNFWGDEAFTTNLVANTIPVIIKQTAADVHPPLYYLIVKIGYMIVGNQGWMFHLISLIPCAIILIFSLTVVWNRFGREAAVILMTLASLSKNAVTYNVEECILGGYYLFY